MKHTPLQDGALADAAAWRERSRASGGHGAAARRLSDGGASSARRERRRGSVPCVPGAGEAASGRVRGQSPLARQLPRSERHDARWVHYRPDRYGPLPVVSHGGQVRSISNEKV